MQNLTTSLNQLHISKQLRYYYNHKQERLAYAKRYYKQHQNTIRTRRLERYHKQQVKRTQTTNSVIRQIVSYRKVDREFKDIFNHIHGRPKEERLYDTLKTRGIIQYHMLPTLKFVFEVIELPKYDTTLYNLIRVAPEYQRVVRENEVIISAKQLTVQTAHLLGLHCGDTIIWHESNGTHTLAFDGSGLDISHTEDLPKLMAMRIETGLKGDELLIAFANKYSVNNYLQVFRGNKLLLSSEFENSYRDYLKHFPMPITT